MNKRIDPKKQGDVVVTAAAQVPASKQPPNRWKQFRILCEKADKILKWYVRLNEIQEQLEMRESGERLPLAPENCLSDKQKAEIAEVRQMLAEIDCEAFYEEDDAGDRVLKKEIISERLALTMSAVHIGGPKTPEERQLFAEICLAHVF